MTENSQAGPEPSRRRPLFWGAQILAPLIVGVVLALWAIPAPKIGIVRLEGEIHDALSDYVAAQLDYARSDPSIRAVVLKVNSPGGGVTASENLYFSLLAFRESKPLVVSVDTMAASGGYYAAAAGELIFAKPSSSVGNVGVVSFMPSPSFVDEEMVSTGPFKLFGASRSTYGREMEMLKQGFLRAISAQRGDRLKIDMDMLSRGEMYVGMRAQELGLIDRIGTLSDAVEAAAGLARLRQYQVVEIETEAGLHAPSGLELTIGQSESKGGPGHSPGQYYLYVDPAEVVK